MLGVEAALATARLDVGAHLDHALVLAPVLGGAMTAVPSGARGDGDLWRRRHMYAASIADCSQWSNMRRSGSRQLARQQQQPQQELQHSYNSTSSTS